MHRSWLNATLLVLCTAGLATGAVAWWLQVPRMPALAFVAATLPVLVALAVGIVRDLRRGESGVDIIAVLAMGGALALGEYLAGAVIALMFASGQALEDYAGARARRELSSLLARTPKTAHRYVRKTLEEISIAAVQAGDRLLVRSGEVVPVDGLVLSEAAILDESALTGEAIPVSRPRNERIRSGTVNAGSPFDLQALASAEHSTYAGVVRLVQAAQAEKAPFARLADRYALLFVPLTLGVAGLAWLFSGEAVRALAVLVVATPCPLILAVPAAIVSGISRAARRGVLVKGGGALETMARARVLLFDKTGTLTLGAARLTAIEICGGLDPAELLRLAASLEQASQHVMAKAVVRAARTRELALSLPAAVEEVPGAGLSGIVDDHRVVLGSFAHVTTRVPSSDAARRLLQRMGLEGASGVFVAVDGRIEGALFLADAIRAETPKALRALRRLGVAKIIMVSGDRQDVAETIASALGVDTVLAERTPEDKVDAVRAERAEAVTIMVGDGINDAPALAAADVGIAMGAGGAGASSEAADAVLMIDRLDRLGEALLIARRSRDIALQSVIAGMGLSLLAMVAAAFGMLAPVAGAVLQEGIDVAVIVNALRALRPGRAAAPEPTIPRTTAERLKAEHRELDPFIERIQSVADQLDRLSRDEARAQLSEVEGYLRDHLLPHEAADDAELYPRLAELMGGHDPMGAMSRTHREIAHLARLYERMLAGLPAEGPREVEVRDLRRVLYGLNAILRLHMAQEEEIYETMAEEAV